MQIKVNQVPKIGNVKEEISEAKSAIKSGMDQINNNHDILMGYGCDPYVLSELKASSGYELYKNHLTKNYKALILWGIVTAILTIAVSFVSLGGILIAIFPIVLFWGAKNNYKLSQNSEPIAVCRGTIEKLAKKYQSSSSSFIYNVHVQTEDGLHLLVGNFPSSSVNEHNNVQNLNVGDSCFIFLSESGSIPYVVR